MMVIAKPLVRFQGVDWDKEDEKSRARFQRKKRKRCLKCLKIRLTDRFIAAMAEYAEYLAFLRAASENEVFLRSDYCGILLDLAATRGLLDDDDWAEAPPVLQLQHLVDTFKLWWGQNLRDRPFGALLRVLHDWRADVEQLQGEGVPSPPMRGSGTTVPFEYSREMKGKVQNVLSSEATDKEKIEQVTNLVGEDDPVWMHLEGYLNLAGAGELGVVQVILGDHMSSTSSSSGSSSVTTPPAITRRLQLAELLMAAVKASSEGGYKKPPAMPPLAKPKDEGSGSFDGEKDDPLPTPAPTPQVQTMAALPEEYDKDGTDEDSEGRTPTEVPAAAGSKAVAGGTTEVPTAATVSPTTIHVTCTCPSPCSIM